MKYSGENSGKTLSFKLEIGGSPELLKVVRACISEFGLAYGMSSNEIYDINLSVNEICANIMEHDYHWDLEQKIVISVENQADGLEIRVRDFAPKKDPSLFQSRNLEEMEGSGLGIFLVGELMDEVRYNDGVKNGNEIIMKKNHVSKMENEYGI